MRFRPCIDIHQEKVKQIVGGTLTGAAERLVENFVAEKDAAWFARMYRDDGLTGGHVIMLGPGNEEEALKALEAFPGGMQIGGGINTGNAARFLTAGASHVIVTSYVFKNGKIHFNNLVDLVSLIGKDRLVLDLSCRKKGSSYYVVTEHWQKFTSFEINREHLRQLAKYCNEFLIHAADVEGRQAGIEPELVKILGEGVTIPTTYAGGIHSLGDLEQIYQMSAGKLDFTVGSALDIFGGKLPYREVIKWQPEA